MIRVHLIQPRRGCPISYRGSLHRPAVSKQRGINPEGVARPCNRVSLYIQEAIRSVGGLCNNFNSFQEFKAGGII